MPNVRIATVFAVCLLATMAQAAESSDEARLRSIVADQESAWNRGDGEGFARDAAEGISFTNLFGMVLYGKTAFTDRQRDILAGFYRGTRKSHHIRRIRFVTPDVAIVDIDNELTNVKAMPAGLPVPRDGRLKSQLMQVFVRRGDRWLIEAFHNVDVKVPSTP